MDSNENSRGSFWRIFAAIGGFVGLVTLLALVVAMFQLWQAVESDNRQEEVQATEVAYDQAHLDELIKIVTLQAQLVEGPQSEDAAATIEAQIKNLESTIEATNDNNPIDGTPQPIILDGNLTPIPAPQCPSVISRELIEEWAQIGETSISIAENSINNFDRMRVGGEYKIGDVLPAGVAIVTDFGDGESDIYLTLPVRAIAHYHSWGVFEVTSEYRAIQGGSCMTIMP